MKFLNLATIKIINFLKYKQNLVQSKDSYISVAYRYDTSIQSSLTLLTPYVWPSLYLIPRTVQLIYANPSALFIQPNYVLT